MALCDQFPVGALAGLLVYFPSMDESMEGKMSLRFIWNALRQLFGFLLAVLGLAGLQDDASTWLVWVKYMLPFLQNPYIAMLLVISGATLLAWSWSDLRFEYAMDRRAKLGDGGAVPDMPMRDLFVYLTRYAAAFDLKFEDANDPYLKCRTVERKILNALRTGHLECWGEKRPDTPLAPICKEFWTENKIDLSTLLRSAADLQVHSEHRHAGLPVYNLHVCCARVRDLWPYRFINELMVGNAETTEIIKRGWSIARPEVE